MKKRLPEATVPYAMSLVPTSLVEDEVVDAIGQIDFEAIVKPTHDAFNRIIISRLGSALRNQGISIERETLSDIVEFCEAQFSLHMGLVNELEMSIPRLVRDVLSEYDKQSKPRGRSNKS